MASPVTSSTPSPDPVPSVPTPPPPNTARPTESWWAKNDEEYEASFYRLRAFLTLFATNVICFLLPIAAPRLRKWIGVGLGNSEPRDEFYVILLVLITLTMPCIGCYLFYAAKHNWERLKKEKIYGFHGRLLLACIYLLSFCAVFGIIDAMILSDYEEVIRESVERTRPLHMAVDARLLPWFTAVSILLVLAFFFHLMPIDPYAKEEKERKTRKKKEEESSVGM